MLKMVAVNVIAVLASFNTNDALPKDAGRGVIPSFSVGTAGGTS
jgi:hypothetical protein